jgi:ABC-type Fe3+ transport system substrate-binding protein
VHLELILDPRLGLRSRSVFRPTSQKSREVSSMATKVIERRAFLRAAAGVGAFGLLPAISGCGKSPGDGSSGADGRSVARGRVVVYVSADDVLAREVFAACSAATGITIDAVFDTEATKTTGLENRVRSERSRPRADIFWSSEGFSAVRMANDGLIAPFPSDFLPSWPSQYRDPSQRWLAFAARARVVAYVPRRGTPPLALWGDFARSGVARGTKASIAIADPRFGTTRSHFAALADAWSAARASTDAARASTGAARASTDAARASTGAARASTGAARASTDAARASTSAAGASTGAADANPAANALADTAAPDYDAWIDAMRANGVLVLTGGNAATVEAVISGECAYGFTDTDDVFAAQARGLDVDMFIPRSMATGVAGGGTMLVPNTVSLVAGREATLASSLRVVEFLVSPTCESIICRSSSRNLPLGPGVDCNPGFAEPDPLVFNLASAAARADAHAVQSKARLEGIA